MAAASTAGLSRQPTVYGPRVVFAGTHNDQPVRLEWRGGLRGAHTVLVRNGAKTRYPLVSTAAQLEDVLA